MMLSFLSKRTIPTTALPHHTAPKPRLWLTGATRSGQPGARPERALRLRRVPPGVTPRPGPVLPDSYRGLFMMRS